MGVAAFWHLSSMYSGQVVAVLPFTPPSFIQRFLTLRTLPSTVSPSSLNFRSVFLLANLGPKAVVTSTISLIKGEDGSGGMKAVFQSGQVKKLMKRMGYTEEDVEGMDEVIKMLPM